jgi:hypothetical protein
MAIEPDGDWAVRSQIAASVVGALVGLRFAPGYTMLARVTNLIGGFASAYWGTQVLVWFMKIESVGAIAGMSFIVGVLGMVLLDAVAQGLHDTKVGEFFNKFLTSIASWVEKKEEKKEG